MTLNTDEQSAKRDGRVILVTIPPELFETFGNPGLAMHLYSSVSVKARYARRAFKKNARNVTLEHGDSVFFVRKFCTRWGYNRAAVTRMVRAFAFRGYWSIKERADGFTLKVTPLYKVPEIAASQVITLNRASERLRAEARRDFLLEQARALTRQDQAMSQGLGLELSAILSGCNSRNAASEPGIVPVTRNLDNPLDEVNTAHCENPPAEEFVAPSTLVNAALNGPLNPLDGPKGSSGDERSASPSQAAVEPLEARGDASGVAGKGWEDFELGDFAEFAFRGDTLSKMLNAPAEVARESV